MYEYLFQIMIKKKHNDGIRVTKRINVFSDDGHDTIKWGLQLPLSPMQYG